MPQIENDPPASLIPFVNADAELKAPPMILWFREFECSIEIAESEKLMIVQL